MNYRSIFLITSILLLIGGVTYFISHNSVQGKEVNVYSVYSSALKVKKEHTIRIDESKSLSLGEEKVEDKELSSLHNVSRSKYIQKYITQLEHPQRELGFKLETLKSEHYDLLSKLRRQGVEVNAFMYLKPQLAIVLAIYLNRSISDLYEVDLSQLQITNKQWYLLKTFADSNDLKVLLQRSSLTISHIPRET